MAHLFVFPALMVHWLFWVVLAATADAAVGIVFALVGGNFDMQKVAGWLVTNVVSVVVPVVVVAALASGGIVPLYVFYGACLTALATFLGGISAKVGIPLKFTAQPPSAAPPAPSA